jgi:uncharacterized membrane protein YwzB
MTAPTSTLPAPVSSMTVFRRAIVAELVRLLTVRSTWWALLAAAALMLFIGGASAARHSGREPAPIWIAAETATIPGQFVFLVLVLLAITGEYATGAIRSSLQWVPKRAILLAARTAVSVAVTTMLAVVVAATTDLVAWAFLGDAAEIIPEDIATSLGRIALVIAFGSLLTVGLGLFLRSTAGTLAVIFLLMLALPIALGNSGVDWLIAVSDSLPGRAVVAMIVADEAMEASKMATVITGWTAAALIVGGWSMIRRDTT